MQTIKLDNLEVSKYNTFIKCLLNTCPLNKEDKY